MKLTSTYVPPANFTEFLERYPRLIARIVRKHLHSFTGETFDDLHQEICLFLTSLPEDSIHRARGCTDRISIFDASYANDDVEGFFVNFVWKRSEQHLYNLYSKVKRRRCLVPLELTCQEPEDGEYRSFEAPWMLSKEDAGFSARYKELLQRAKDKHPLLPVVLALRAEGRTQREISRLIGRNVKYTGLLVRMLRALVADDAETLAAWKPRLEARRRTKRTARRTA